MFSDDLDALIAENKLLASDYEDLEKLLSLQPDLGALITGMGGLRKIRLKSASKGEARGISGVLF